jgi:hypothetical protein
MSFALELFSGDAGYLKFGGAEHLGGDADVYLFGLRVEIRLGQRRAVRPSIAGSSSVPTA